LIQLRAFVQKRILNERDGKMTRSSADLRDDKLTSSRASISPPFDDTRDDEEEDNFFDAEAGWYVLVSIFTLPIYFRNLKLIYYDATKQFSRLSITVITLCPVPPINYHLKTKEKRKNENERYGHYIRQEIL
jgi:hypothetical protein